MSDRTPQAAPRNRKCGNCRFYEPAPLWRKGWCRNPKLYPPHANHLVDATTIDCEGGFRSRIYWEPVPAGQAAAHPAAEAPKRPPQPQPAAQATQAFTNVEAPAARFSQNQPTQPVTPVQSSQQQPFYSPPAPQPETPVMPGAGANREPLINRFRKVQQPPVEDVSYSEQPTEPYRQPEPPRSAPSSVGNYRTDARPSSLNDYLERAERAAHWRPLEETKPEIVPVPAAETPRPNGYNAAEAAGNATNYTNYAPPEVEQRATQFDAPQAPQEADYRPLDEQRPPAAPMKTLVRPPQPTIKSSGNYAPGVGQTQPGSLQPGGAPKLEFRDQIAKLLAAVPPVKIGKTRLVGMQVVVAAAGAFIGLIILIMLLGNILGGNRNQPTAGTGTPGSVAVIGSSPAARATTSGTGAVATAGTQATLPSNAVQATAAFPTPTSAATPTPQPTTPPATTAAVTATVKTATVSGNGETPLNVRETPSTKAKVVLTIKEGEKVKILEGPQDADGRTWYKVEYNGKSGWSVKDFLKL